MPELERVRRVLRAFAHEKAGAPDQDPGRRHDATPWARHNRALLCQATLSIGPYLLLKVQFQRFLFTLHIRALNPKSRSPDKDPGPL